MPSSPAPAPRRRCAIYTRVSTRHQAEEGFSLDEQRRRLTEYAAAQGWASRLYEEAGRSAETLDGRPQMMALLAAADGGEFDVALVVDGSRLARDDLVAALIRRRLRLAGVALATPAGELDLNDPSQKFTAEVLASAHALEQGMRTAKMTQGLRAAVQAGFWPGGPPPFGLRLVADPEGSTHKVLAVNEHEAATLRRAIELIVDEGRSTYAACERLNAEGHQTRKGRRFRHENLLHSLKNKHLMGRWTYDTREGPITLQVPAILTPQRFEALQSALKRRSLGPREVRHIYPLTGRVQCRCGGALCGVWRKEYRRRYYACSLKGPQEGEHRCPHFPKQRRADDLERQVWHAVYRALTDPGFLIGLADEYHATREAAAEREDEQRAALQRRLDGLLADEVHVMRSRDLAPEVAQRALLEIAVERGEVEKALAQLRRWEDRRQARERRHAALRHLATTARARLQDPSLELMAQVFDLLELEVREVGEPTRNDDGTWTCALEIRGIIPAAGPEEQGDGLALAVGSELPKQGLQHPTPHRRLRASPSAGRRVIGSASSRSIR